MHVIELPWETWRAIIDALRAKGLSHMLEHANTVERQLDQHAPVEPMVTLRVSDDVYLRSYNGARLELVHNQTTF